MRLVSGKGGLRPYPAFWKIIEKVNKQVDPAQEISYDQFLAAADASPFEKLVAKSYVEGFNAARTELISVSAVAIADHAVAEIEGTRQFRLSAGYGSLIDWLAAGLPSDSLYLQTNVKEIRWQQGHVEVVADCAHREITFLAAGLVVTVPLGILQLLPGTRGAIQFVPPLPQKEAALQHLQVGHVIKLMICFRERFWRIHGQFAFVISFDRDIPTWWTQEPLTSNVLTGWAGGSAAERLLNLSRRTPRLRHWVFGSDIWQGRTVATGTSRWNLLSRLEQGSIFSRCLQLSEGRRAESRSNFGRADKRHYLFCRRSHRFSRR